MEAFGGQKMMMKRWEKLPVAVKPKKEEKTRMESGDKKVVWIVGISAAVVVSLIVGLIWMNIDIHRKAFENGYSEEMLPGSQTAHWVKK